MQSKQTEKKSNNYLVRRAIVDDAFQLAEINYNWWTQCYRGIIDDEFLDSINLKIKRRRTVEIMKNDYWKSICLVYEFNKKILWFVHWGEKKDKDISYEAEIYAIYVDATMQGKGIWTVLMNSILETPYFKNKQSVYLRTLANKHETRWFYEKLWWKIFAKKEREIGGKKYPIVGYFWEKK